MDRRRASSGRLAVPSPPVSPSLTLFRPVSRPRPRLECRAVTAHVSTCPQAGLYAEGAWFMALARPPTRAPRAAPLLSGHRQPATLGNSGGKRSSRDTERRHDMSTQTKTVLITGSSSGIGFDIARAFLGKGSNASWISA